MCDNLLCKRACVCDDDDDDDDDEDDEDDDDDDDDRDDDADADVGALLGGVTALPELSFAQNPCPALTLTFWFAREHGILICQTRKRKASTALL